MTSRNAPGPLRKAKVHLGGSCLSERYLHLVSNRVWKQVNFDSYRQIENATDRMCPRSCFDDFNLSRPTLEPNYNQKMENASRQVAKTCCGNLVATNPTQTHIQTGSIIGLPRTEFPRCLPADRERSRSVRGVARLRHRWHHISTFGFVGELGVGVTGAARAAHGRGRGGDPAR
jgi:hypothetical protein